MSGYSAVITDRQPVVQVSQAARFKPPLILIPCLRGPFFDTPGSRDPVPLVTATEPQANPSMPLARSTALSRAPASEPRSHPGTPSVMASVPSHWPGQPSAPFMGLFTWFKMDCIAVLVLY